LQPFSLTFRPPCDGLRPFGSGDNGGDRDRDDIFYGVQNIDRSAGIVDLPTYVSETLQIIDTDFYDANFLSRTGEDSMMGFWLKTIPIASLPELPRRPKVRAASGDILIVIVRRNGDAENGFIGH